MWHPISPSRPDAALADMADIAPHTVVWLREAPTHAGREVAADLRACPHDLCPGADAGHLLARALADLTTRAPDRHAHARS